MNSSLVIEALKLFICLVLILSFKYKLITTFSFTLFATAVDFKSTKPKTPTIKSTKAILITTDM